MTVPQIAAIVVFVLALLLMAAVCALTWIQYRQLLKQRWHQHVVVRYLNNKAQINSWLKPKVHAYFERRLNDNAEVHQDGDIFAFAAKVKWLWVKRERVFRVATLQRIDDSDVWFVELQTIYGGEMVRGNSGKLFFDRVVAERVAKAAVMGELDSRPDNFDASNGYGTHWVYYREEYRSAGFQPQCFTMRHVASPDGGPLAYVSVGTMPGRGIIQQGMWTTNTRMSKNPQLFINIDVLCKALNGAVRNKEQALAKQR